MALGLAHERFAVRSEPLVPRFAEQNARTAIILQVEDPRGAAAADEIAAMPGVDMLWLGHNDLSVALGEPGAFDHSDFVKAEQATIAAAKKHGKSVGRLAVDAKQGAQFAAMGYDFVSIAGDVWLLQQAFAAGLATVQQGLTLMVFRTFRLHEAGWKPAVRKMKALSSDHHRQGTDAADEVRVEPHRRSRRSRRRGRASASPATGS